MTRLFLFGLAALAGLGCGDDDARPACMGAPGTVNCACRGDLSCDDGLTCEMNMCVAATAAGLVLPAGARGCDVLLSAPGGGSVDFGEGTTGTFVLERPNLAVSVVVSGEVDAPPTAIQVFSSSELSLVSSSCVDGTGAVLGGAEVTLR